MAATKTKKTTTKKVTVTKAKAKNPTLKKGAVSTKTKTVAKPQTKLKTKAVAKKKAIPEKKQKAVEKKTVKKKEIKVVKQAVKKATKKVAEPKKAVKTKVAKKTKVTVERQQVETPKPILKIKGYSKEELEHFRAIILNKKKEILEQLQNLKEQMLDPTTGVYINENSPYSLHMAEQGTDAMEREKTFLYAQRENKFLGYLEDALKRIDAGTYGICIECIEEPQHLCPTCPLIPKARLEAVPHSQLCVPIKMRQEKKK
ncbi:MAG: TraR/DksA family transcriptional regulator [Ignavibacteriales bacterium]|jgi:RNA polymerase-binding transcription factor DksA|nr:conjugal transfer protein TraR [Ignavibacteriaceae bacterium]NLH60037.1 TraR/DksA family transcriptional regulator [Ignavibacteriales bacterium]HOJ18512.1 conjugal transfer protein TraR [Ignavibacteriaceae bacterium]